MHERKIKGNKKTSQNAYLLGSYALSCLRAACWIEHPALCCLLPTLACSNLGQ